jgi:Ca2+-transporting ATPase
LGRPQWLNVVGTGLLQAVVTFSVFAWALGNRSLIQARTLAFLVIVLAEVLRSFSSRSTTRLFWEVGAFTNLWLLGVVAFSLALQTGIHTIPAAASFFQLGTLSPADAMLAVLAGLVPVTVIELTKLLRRCSWVATRGSG